MDVVVGTTTNGSMLLYDIINLAPAQINEKSSRVVQPNSEEGYRSDATASDISIRNPEQKSQEKFSAAADVSEADSEAYGTTAFMPNNIYNEKAELSTTASGANTVSDIQESSDARRGSAPRAFAAGVNGNNAADANSSGISIHSSKQKSQENFSASGGTTLAPYALLKIRTAPNFIRQIFNGRTRNDTHSASCDAETRFYGRPSGRSLTAGVTTTRKTERPVFSRVSAISFPASLFCILFSGKTEKSMPAERRLRCHRKNGTAVNPGKAAPRTLCAKSLPHPSDAVPSAPSAQLMPSQA